MVLGGCCCDCDAVSFRSTFTHDIISLAFRYQLSTSLNDKPIPLTHLHKTATTNSQDTATNTHAIKETKKQLKRCIKNAESTLSDLETTVRVVETKRDKFPHISNNEISSRRNFVSDVQMRIVRSKEAMNGEEVKGKLLKDERALTERRRGNKGKGVLKGGRDGSGLSRQNTNNSNEALLSSSSAAAAEEGRSETILMMQQQDDTLDDLNQAVVRVGHMADTIHEEIGSQNNMLKSLEEDLADAEEQLGVVMGRLAKLLKTKNKCQLGLIVVLTLVVLVLFFLVLYT